MEVVEGREKDEMLECAEEDKMVEAVEEEDTETAEDSGEPDQRRYFVWTF